MKDLDFDELDQAVNSLMGTAKVNDNNPSNTQTSTSNQTSAGAPESSTPAAADQPLSQDSTIPSSDPVAAEAPKPAVTPRPAEPGVNPTRTQSPATASIQRKPGRFMDVMHPSIDMKQSNTGSNPQPNTTRKTISPLSSMSQPQASEEVKPSLGSQLLDSATAVRPSTEPKVEPPQEVAPTLSQVDEKSDESQTSEAPAQDNDIAKELGLSDQLANPMIADESTDSKPTLPTYEAAEESPFLTDTKVEKRPLGGSQPQDENNLAVQNDATDNNQQPVPEELNSDVMAVESAGTASKPTQPVAKTAPIAPAELAMPKQSASGIANEDHTPMYDTSHDAPLDHPAKKKSGWLWILWIILLLAIGVGGAVALYFSGLI